ncbi:MAG: MFS transporter, partial [Planctomycetota bacterium]
AAVLFGVSFLVAALGVYTHELWLLYLGFGVIGGLGLGFGYVSPVVTLMKWFPQHRGLMSGLVIAGFGGGTMIGIPLTNALVDCFHTPTSNGIAAALATQGGIYFLVMMTAAAILRRPTATAMEPESQDRPHVHPSDYLNAVRTPQFALLWVVLMANVAAGISLLGDAPTILRHTFGEVATPLVIASFLGLLSLFNMGGRVLSAVASDRAVGRNYFTDIAPCTNNRLFFGTFRKGVLAGSMNLLFFYTFTYKMSPTEVKVHLYRSSSGRNWVLVKRK